MSGKQNLPDWDDGRTVADMRDVTRPAMLRPRRGSGETSRETEGPAQSPYTPAERRWAVLGALKATLLIAGAFLLGLALVIALLLLLWK